MERENEKPVNPEQVKGQEFRIPSIWGLGSGRGFEFKNLHLPRGWDKAIPKLKEIDRVEFNSFFVSYCQFRDLQPGELNFDPENGILRSITVRSPVEARLFLSQGHVVERVRGIYKGEHVIDLRAAIALQRIAAKFLNIINEEIGSENSYPYIDGQKGHYFPSKLRIPREFLNPKQALTDANYRVHFALEASNIAGRFGRTLERVRFNKKGQLASFDVNGDSCGFDLIEDGRYIPHNVDHPEQAAALFGIGASFINSLLRRKDGEWY